jgi:hypothetical protein
MNDLIEALQIFSKYGNFEPPLFHCENNSLTVNPAISPFYVSSEDKKRLEELGFFVSTDYGYDIFKSHRFIVS